MKHFNYTITEFDKELKTIKVDFDDGTWAQIQLREPIPTTQQEIDDIVKHYTASLEIMNTRKTEANLDFISDMVGKERTAERHSLSAPIGVPNNLNTNEVLL